ncbi:hypothetical protein G7Y89_g3359 [Cudoniella acicularis]|uniref:Aminoglycoside phosphotransferase domain-containing protein n=1 Tax=Cudoniella acicularis TaxID=354080 RepID=A0A8H4W5N8_9HELO|nr:hypothetical protein G7Y89_g3359 [Cudoniella acicularis]
MGDDSFAACIVGIGLMFRDSGDQPRLPLSETPPRPTVATATSAFPTLAAAVRTQIDMAATSHNHANYQARLDFVQNLLHERFSLKENAEITPIQYDPKCPFKYNNFVYRISLPVPITANQATKDEPQQPGCVPIPDGTRELIFRLTNPDTEGMNQTTRVENEVATIALASAALAGFVPHVVPSVYAWGSAAIESSQGWIIQELMPGAPVDESFDAMDLEQKRQIFAQMAKLLKSLQDYELPESIASFGGVTFDDTGRPISTAMTSVGAGPWSSYEASFKGRLEVALQKADANPYIKGWRANGVRQRLDAFVERGVPAQFEALGSKQDRVIIHADFTANNLLFDAISGRITALIDYDFACVSHPSYEFLRSFDGAGGQFRGWSSGEASEDMTVREAKLHGFPSPLPPATKDGVKWDVMKAWEDELEKLDVKRPRNIPGIDKVADVDTILRTILPWRVSNSDILRLQSEEVIIKCRNENEEQLVRLLSHLGF